MDCGIGGMLLGISKGRQEGKKSCEKGQWKEKPANRKYTAVQDKTKYILLGRKRRTKMMEREKHVIDKQNSVYIRFQQEMKPTELL